MVKYAMANTRRFEHPDVARLRKHPPASAFGSLVSGLPLLPGFTKFGGVRRCGRRPVLISCDTVLRARKGCATARRSGLFNAVVTGFFSAFPFGFAFHSERAKPPVHREIALKRRCLTMNRHFTLNRPRGVHFTLNRPRVGNARDGWQQFLLNSLQATSDYDSRPSTIGTQNLPNRRPAAERLVYIVRKADRAEDATLLAGETLTERGRFRCASGPEASALVDLVEVFAMLHEITTGAHTPCFTDVTVPHNSIV